MIWSRCILAAVLLSTSATLAAAPPPKNIILLIADGIGLSHYTAMKHHRAADFNIGRMPVVGLATTRCADRAVTDSAAAATALATGVKTNYEAVGIDANGASLTTILEFAEARGKLTGLVTTGAFYDATPAAFAAEVKHRAGTADIAMQMLRSGADVIAGTGLLAIHEKPEMAGILTDARLQGYTVATTREELDAATGTRVLAVFPEQARDLDFPAAPLPDLASWAIERLRGSAKGFFLMIEHEGTDSSSHQNNGPDAIASLVSFDKAIGAALDFAAKSRDTLVIVTSDHETGGLRITETATRRALRLEWSTTDHTGVAVPVFAFGPGSESFAGFYDNTDIAKRMIGFVQARP